MPIKILFLSLIILFSACASSVKTNQISKNAPTTRITLLNGEYISLNKFYDKNLVLVFWAKWCARSRKNLKILNEIAGDVRFKNKYKFIAVSLDAEKHIYDLQEYIMANQLNNLTHSASGNQGSDEAFIAFNGGNLPHIFLIKNGKIIKDTHNAKELKEFLN